MGTESERVEEVAGKKIKTEGDSSAQDDEPCEHEAVCVCVCAVIQVQN